MSLELPDDKWAPLLYTPSMYDRTRGDEVSEFAAKTMFAIRGMKKGQRLLLNDWQRWLMNSLLEVNENGVLRYRRAIVGLPRKNGKSLLGTSMALEKLFFSDAGTEIYSAARDRAQAKLVFEVAKKQVINNPILSRVITCRRDYLENNITGGIYRALSADGMSAQGLGPELVIADELHAWSTGRGEELWAALTEGSGDRPESLVVAITTAGASKEELLGRLYTHGEGIINGEIVDPSFGLFWWGAKEEDDPLEEKTWLKANPNLAEGLMSTEDFISSAATATTTSLNEFKRYRLNQWVRVGGEMYITPSQWEAAKKFSGSIPKGADIFVGFDGSINDDSTGFVAIDANTGQIELLAGWEAPKNDKEWNVPRDDVLAAKERIFEEYNVLKLWCDPYGFRTDIEGWARQHGGRVIDIIPQSPSRMRPMSEKFKQDILDGTIGHSGQRRLSMHAMNAVETSEGKIKKDKPNSPRKIDFIIASILANGARTSVEKRVVRPIIVSG